jgi:hypothetical protein
MRRFPNFASLLFATSISACSTIPVSSMLALSRIDFTTTRIDALRVAIELPSAIKPRVGGVHMDVVAKLGEKEDKFTFKLAEDQAQIGMKGLLPIPEAGKQMHAYRLRDEDAATLMRLRAERQSNKVEGEQGSLAIGVAAKEFCRNSSLADVELTVTTFIATSETNGFVTVSKNYDLRGDQKIAAEVVNMPLCKK